MGNVTKGMGLYLVNPMSKLERGYASGREEDGTY